MLVKWGMSLCFEARLVVGSRVALPGPDRRHAAKVPCRLRSKVPFTFDPARHPDLAKLFLLSRSFWLGLAYVLFPLNLLVYGLNAGPPLLFSFLAWKRGLHRCGAGCQERPQLGVALKTESLA